MVELKQKLKELIKISIILSKENSEAILSVLENMTEKQVIAMVKILDTEKQFIDKTLDRELEKVEKQELYQDFLESIITGVKRILTVEENLSTENESSELDDLENQLNSL